MAKNLTKVYAGNPFASAMGVLPASTSGTAVVWEQQTENGYVHSVYLDSTGNSVPSYMVPVGKSTGTAITIQPGRIYDVTVPANASSLAVSATGMIDGYCGEASLLLHLGLGFPSTGVVAGAIGVTVADTMVAGHTNYIKAEFFGASSCRLYRVDDWGEV